MNVYVSIEGAVDADAAALEAAGERVVEALAAEGELSILLCDDAYIAQLNAEWRAKDGPTDVLSFPQDGDVLLGDVVISVETATRQASELGHSIQTELNVLLVHGICHLLGHDHETDEQTARMRTAEAAGLAALDLDATGLVARVG